MLMDGTSRLRLRDGTTLQHEIRTACFSEYAVVAAGGAVPIARELPLWQAALIGCGVVTGFGAVRNVAGVKRGDSVAVLGCGGVGLQVVAAARLAGADPIVAVDRGPEKLELARAQGATHLVDATTEDRPVSVIRRLTDGGVDYAFEVIGRPETIRLGVGGDPPRRHRRRRRARPAGSGGERAGDRVPLGQVDQGHELWFRRSGGGDSGAGVTGAVAASIDLAGVVTHVDTLEGTQGALERLRRGEGARTVLIVDAELAGRPET